MKPIHTPCEETPEDSAAIEHLLDLSFGPSRRTKMSYRLREGSAPISGLSLLVREEGVGLVGAISFWPLLIGPGLDPALLLGPLAVHPARQRRGIGLALMQEGLERARNKGHELALLIGDAPYYARAGFEQVPEGKLDMPGVYDPKRLLYLELGPGALAGAKGLVLPPWRWREIVEAKRA